MQASVENLLSYFKAANNKNMSESNDLAFETLDNDYINRKITLAEIKNQLKSLKANKSAGIDLIMNEHIKSTWHLMGSVYEKISILYWIVGLYLRYGQLAL